MTLPQQILDLCSWYFFNAFLWNRNCFENNLHIVWCNFKKVPWKNTMERESENFLSTLITSERRLQFRGNDSNVFFSVLLFIWFAWINVFYFMYVITNPQLVMYLNTERCWEPSKYKLGKCLNIKLRIL